ncbi:hypothetical protein [Olleya sp. R77988]|uniref:hypothetical protein n=1 Tax=Olleya sp. R77988 TaxID=3093875 RepID=UPI0037C977D9
MGIFSSFKKKTKEDINDSDYIETIIKHGDGEPLGVASQNVIYGGYNELGGYYYLQTYVIGKLKTKTKTGATLLIEGDNYTLDLKSDMDEIESENVDVFEGFATRIDFETEKETVENLKRSTIKSITLKIKKDTMVFAPFENVSEGN